MLCLPPVDSELLSAHYEVGYPLYSLSVQGCCKFCGEYIYVFTDEFGFVSQSCNCGASDVSP